MKEVLEKILGLSYEDKFYLHKNFDKIASILNIKLSNSDDIDEFSDDIDIGDLPDDEESHEEPLAEQEKNKTEQQRNWHSDKIESSFDLNSLKSNLILVYGDIPEGKNVVSILTDLFIHHKENKDFRKSEVIKYIEEFNRNIPEIFNISFGENINEKFMSLKSKINEINNASITIYSPIFHIEGNDKDINRFLINISDSDNLFNLYNYEESKIPKYGLSTNYIEKNGKHFQFINDIIPVEFIINSEGKYEEVKKVDYSHLEDIVFPVLHDLFSEGFTATPMDISSVKKSVIKPIFLELKRKQAIQWGTKKSRKKEDINNLKDDTNEFYTGIINNIQDLIVKYVISKTNKTDVSGLFIPTNEMIDAIPDEFTDMISSKDQIKAHYDSIRLASEKFNLQVEGAKKEIAESANKKKSEGIVSSYTKRKWFCETDGKFLEEQPNLEYESHRQQGHKIVENILKEEKGHWEKSPSKILNTEDSSAEYKITNGSKEFVLKNKNGQPINIPILHLASVQNMISQNISSLNDMLLENPELAKAIGTNAAGFFDNITSLIQLSQDTFPAFEETHGQGKSKGKARNTKEEYEFSKDKIKWIEAGEKIGPVMFEICKYQLNKTYRDREVEPPTDIESSASLLKNAFMFKYMTSLPKWQSFQYSYSTEAQKIIGELGALPMKGEKIRYSDSENNEAEKYLNMPELGLSRAETIEASNNSIQRLKDFIDQYKDDPDFFKLDASDAYIEMLKTKKLSTKEPSSFYSQEILRKIDNVEKEIEEENKNPISSKFNLKKLYSKLDELKKIKNTFTKKEKSEKNIKPEYLEEICNGFNDKDKEFIYFRKIFDLIKSQNKAFTDPYGSERKETPEFSVSPIDMEKMGKKFYSFEPYGLLSQEAIEEFLKEDKDRFIDPKDIEGSVGIASYNFKESTFDEIVKRGDRNIYPTFIDAMNCLSALPPVLMNILVSDLSWVEEKKKIPMWETVEFQKQKAGLENKSKRETIPLCCYVDEATNTIKDVVIRTDPKNPNKRAFFLKEALDRGEYVEIKNKEIYQKQTDEEYDTSYIDSPLSSPDGRVAIASIALQYYQTHPNEFNINDALSLVNLIQNDGFTISSNKIGSGFVGLFKEISGVEAHERNVFGPDGKLSPREIPYSILALRHGCGLYVGGKEFLSCKGQNKDMFDTANQNSRVGIGTKGEIKKHSPIMPQNFPLPRKSHTNGWYKISQNKNNKTNKNKNYTSVIITSNLDLNLMFRNPYLIQSGRYDKVMLPIFKVVPFSQFGNIENMIKYGINNDFKVIPIEDRIENTLINFGIWSMPQKDRIQ